MTRQTVVLLVDALGWELAQGCPELLQVFPHRRPLETVLGFSTGALPTLFTGRSSAEHGRWLMYRRAGRGPRPFAGFELLGLLPGRVRRSWRLSRALSSVVERRGVRGYFHLYDVPREQLPAFDLPERGDIFAPGGLPVDSLWDELERRGVRWRGWNWRTPESRNLAEVSAALGGGEALLFCYTADLDALLHREGSRGAGVRERLRRYAAWARELLASADARGVDLSLHVLSDHGMVDVTGLRDVMGALRAVPMRWPRDYLAFFDSTMARFWWRDGRARAPVRAALARLGGGHWLTREELERAGAWFPGHDYGEDIFLVDPGQLIVPSFMGLTPVAAMHGYDPAHPDMAAALLSNRALPDGVRHLRDVRGFLEAELCARTAVPASAGRGAA